MKVTLGGDRIGSGNKNQISLKHYERSTFDLGYIWRSTMSAGTIVPFMSELALTGDTMDIDLDIDTRTLPTVGPLYGNFKVEAHVYSVPIRLFQPKINMNLVDIGKEMQNVKLPKVRLYGKNPGAAQINDIDNYHTNPSSLIAQLGYRGIGIKRTLRPESNNKVVDRKFNAVPILAYWEIIKQYYTNKQEGIGYFISGDISTVIAPGENDMIFNDEYGIQHFITTFAQSNTAVDLFWVKDSSSMFMHLDLDVPMEEKDIHRFEIDINGVRTKLVDLFEKYRIDNTQSFVQFWKPKETYINGNWKTRGWTWNDGIISGDSSRPLMKEYDLKNIDNARMALYRSIDEPEFLINDLDFSPYKDILNISQRDLDLLMTNYLCNQDGLAVRTYLSDKFNNWVDTEFISGTNGVASISAVNVVEGQFTIDELNLKNKVYNMLMRIAVSDGTYDSWNETVYDHKRIKEVKSPVFEGGLIKELAFQEVISQTENENASLGTMAGKGVMTDKHKGGKMVIKVDEPSYIIGVVSIVPRIDYSQGNKWDLNLDNFDDFHKPELDQIGFQDLITDQMAWFDTLIEDDEFLEGQPKFMSAGKVPAWIDYMSNVNVIRGNFGNNEQMWMTLNRGYEYDWEEGIKDLTTYIDPAKFNSIFADARRDAQNFMVQIKVDNKARRKMSSKLMPNL